MATPLSCPHCKASYRIPPGYTVEAIRCNQCDTSFRVPSLAPTLRASDWLESSPVMDQGNPAESPILDAEAVPSVLPFDRVERTTAVPELQPIGDDRLPADSALTLTPDDSAPRFLQSDETPLVLEELEPSADAVTYPAEEAPILLEEMHPTELDENPIAAASARDVDSRPKSLLDSLDLSLPAQHYLPPVEADAPSLLDAIDLTLRSEPIEAEPILLEEFEPVVTPDVSPDAPLSLAVAEPTSANAEDLPPIVTELMLQLSTPAESEAEASPKSARSSDRPRRASGRPRRGSDRRASRRRPISPTRRSAEWLAGNKAPVIIGSVLLATVIAAILLVNLLDGRKSSRTVSAAEQRRQQQMNARESQPVEQPAFQPPMMPNPNFPNRDPRFDAPGDDARRPFMQPPVFHPKQSNVPESKKQRPKSNWPQEKREWIPLAENALNIDAAAGAPRIDSTPVELAAKGTTYNYLFEVWTRTSGTKAILEWGPPGMKLQADARLVWEVPSDFPETEADITLRIQQPDGKECTQTFVITIR